LALISLVLSFFLLLISNTQNIMEAIWEYGVLRSMGVTEDEGKRIYMYEAFTVVGAAGLLGMLVGVVTAFCLSYEFIIFLELDMELQFPWLLILLMSLIAGFTTYLSVSVPVNKVNKRQIA
jgi:ABC-type antimicrobial peptide transport system permease subunit